MTQVISNFTYIKLKEDMCFDITSNKSEAFDSLTHQIPLGRRNHTSTDKQIDSF